MIKPGMFISDRYEIVDKVGSGGMADVYKAKCHRLNRYVAIKILKPEYSSDKNFVAKFRGEAQSVAGLSHPNIVNVYDVGDDDGLYYIVMELVEGITLKKFIERKGRLEIKEAVGIAIQIAQGMEAAHDNHIIHRDIKPQNIIISRDGKVKVTDFGIAKAASTNTVTQNAIGSVHYLSPEQARGGYSDERSDIYSLGVTLYEMLSGQVPFAGDNTVSVALLHIQGEATPLRELNPDVPVSVEKIVQKCMQKKPERRYLTARDLISDLKKSITNKDGDYVVIANSTVTDSPTINLTDDEMNHIKSAAKTPVTLYDNKTKNKSKKVQKEEEEELDSMDSKVEKFLVAGMIITAVVLGIAVIYIVSKILGVFGEKNDTKPTIEPTITVAATPTPTQDDSYTLARIPQVVGLTLDMAKASLEVASKDFQIVFAENEEYHDTIPKGSVTAQDPPEGTQVPSNATITLTISAGPEPLQMPDVYNRTYEQAKAQLEENGLIVKPAVFEANNELEAGMVIRTEPERTTDPANPVIVYKGQEIILYVSSGPDIVMTTVPSLLGMSATNAEAELKKYNLSLGSINYISSELYNEGLVCLQSYTANQSVPEYTKVDISISTGPEVTATPEPTSEPTPTPEPVEPEYSYFGEVSITTNPLSEGETGNIILELEQAGETFTIINTDVKYEDFEDEFSYVPFEGIQEGTATVKMYVDDILYPETWSVNLVKERVN